MANRVSQTGTEVVRHGSPNARVSQIGVEVVREGAPNARVSQFGVEVVVSAPTSAHLRVSQFGVEVVRSAPFVGAPFITSATAVYAPALIGQQAVPFIASATVVYTPTLSGASTEVDVPFIASKTHLYAIFSLYIDRLFVGAGNGGETFVVELAPNGASVTATLAAGIGPTSTTLNLSGDSGLPSTKPFVLTIDDEVIYVVRASLGHYRIAARALSNTAVASHTAGASATWDDSYDMAVGAADDIAASFTADIEGSGSTSYPGWLICFDSTQAYLAGSRYPMHVTSVLGVFDAGAGSTGTNRCDAAQPNAIATAAAASDNCPAALSNPSRIATDILAGDIALIRYTNPEASALDLGPRSAALQSGFGLKRVDATDVDVTFIDPNGIVVDTTGGEGTFTGSVNGEWLNPLGPGIAPETGLPTNHDVPYTSVTLPGTDRDFTVTAEKGWPICALSVRQGRRRVPFWQSWDWHNFNYVYAGFFDDATYCQLVINRNGAIFGSVPEVDLPGPQDIDGPDAVWDDGSYYFGASWYVAIFGTPYLVIGPSIGGTAPTLTVSPLPVVDFTLGPSSPVIHNPSSPPAFVEGGSGGGIEPAGGLHLWQRV